MTMVTEMLFGWIAFALLSGAAGWAAVTVWRIIAIGSAYKAKVLASGIFGSGRALDPRRAEEVSADTYWPLRLFHARIDPADQSVTVSFLGLRPRSAVGRAGMGATLVDLRASDRTDRTAEPGPARRSIEAAVSWLEEPGSRALQAVVQSAFLEPNPRRLRRTRAIVVVRDGRIVAERYAPDVSQNTPLPGWSMTKSVFGGLAGVLVGEGRLSLQYKGLVPQWPLGDPRTEITLEDLLRMRSGLRFSEVYSDFSSDVIEMLFNQRDASAYAASLPLDHPPGMTWSYSSGTTNILSSIIRRAVGDAEYLQWPRRALFDPVGMRSAILEPDASGTFVGSSFMLATARDWARFGQLHLQDGVWEGVRILPQGWVDFSSSPTPQSGGMYGAHWWLKLRPEMGGGTSAATAIPSDAFFAVGHEGQVLTIIPSQRLVVVRLGLAIHIDAWNHAAFIADLQDAL